MTIAVVGWYDQRTNLICILELALPLKVPLSFCECYTTFFYCTNCCLAFLLLWWTHFKEFHYTWVTRWRIKNVLVLPSLTRMCNTCNPIYYPSLIYWKKPHKKVLAFHFAKTPVVLLCASTNITIIRKIEKSSWQVEAYVVLAPVHPQDGDTFGVNKWSLRLITHHYECIAASHTFPCIYYLMTSQLDTQIGRHIFQRRRGNF